MIISSDKLRTPLAIFFIYTLVYSLLIMIFRFILPGSQAPLWIYSRNWRFVQGLLELFNLFPAIALSALVIPFGLFSDEDNYQSFSDIFFKRLIYSVITAICAAVMFGAIFFLALPMVKNYEENMRFKGELFNLAKIQVQEKRSSGEWSQAYQFLEICDRIWPNCPDLADLRIEIEINLQRIFSMENEERYQAQESLARDRRGGAAGSDFSTFSGIRPADAVQAVSMSRAAFDEHRFFDAHWLATLGGRLAMPGSPEAANAARLASEAWNMISSQRPNSREEHLYNIYNLKLSGYQAMNTGDWIRAYYIFLELLKLTPLDPDAVNFFEASERGALEYAFFIDEMQMSLGEILTGAIFSLTGENGRTVLRFSSLTSLSDITYGTGLEYMAFDANSHLVANVRSRYAKVLPFSSGENPQVLILMHALDRYNIEGSYDSEWLAGEKTAGGIILNISYEDLMMLAEVRRGIANLQINELFAASGKLNSAGYIYQIFQAEILNRLGTVLFFLPVAILVIVFGWRYRVKSRPRYIFVLMLPVLPFVFNGLVFLYRSVFNTMGIWLILSIGWTAALAVYIAIFILSLFASLIALAAQRV